MPILDTEGNPLQDDQGKVQFRTINDPIEIQRIVNEIEQEQKEEKARKKRLE